jgi:hypothetical protein
MTVTTAGDRFAPVLADLVGNIWQRGRIVDRAAPCGYVTCEAAELKWLDRFSCSPAQESNLRPLKSPIQPPPKGED